MNPLKRLFSYTFRFKFSFILSIFGFVLFASADIAAVEWIRRIIEYINSDQEDFSLYLVLALIFIAMGRGSAAGFMRLTRSAMLEVLDSEYVRLARLKGVNNRTVIWKHALRNSLIVPFTVSALLLAGLVTGTVIVEVVFAWPGLGRLAVEAVANNNLNLVVGTTLVFGAVFIIINFLVDIGYMFIDPRIRLS